MTITKEGGQWYMRLQVRGRRIHEPTRARTRAGALKVEAERRLQLIEGDDPRLKKAPTLAEFSKTFIAHIRKRVDAKSLKPKTLSSYQYGSKLLAATKLWSWRIDKIGRPEAAELSFDGSGSRANQALRTLSAVLGHAEASGILRAKPTIDLRDEEGRERTFAPWEESLFLKFATPVLRDILLIMLDCGMRPDEVCRMVWADIDWTEGHIQIQRGKTAKARRKVGLTQRMRDTFAGIRGRNEKRKLSDSLFVFPSPRNKNGHISWLSAVWARTYERVESAIGKPLATGLVPYSARHTYATNFLHGGGDIGQLSRLMGHSDIRTTMRYVHLLEANDAARIMDSHNERNLAIVRKRA